MKRKYDTVAICNALVDIEIKVSELEFKQLRFSKGSMTLVDVDESRKLLEKFKSKPKIYSSGGSVGNTVYAMSKFNCKVGIIGNVGNDDFGRKYCQDFKKVGVDFLGRKLDKKTGVCLVLVTPDTARTLITTLGCASDFTTEILEQVFFLSTKSIYLESYLLTNRENIKLLSSLVDKLKKMNKKVILSDSDWFCVNMFSDIYTRLFKKVDIFFANADQFKAMCGYNHDEEADIEKCFYRYVAFKNRPKLMVVTHSKYGAYLSRVEGRKIPTVHVPAEKVKVVDSNGAGDGFAAGVLTEYFQGSSITKMGKRGALVASRIISKFGARYR